ncbi:hypothetical protein MKW98_009486 [Papaver atlanticum]|uniref:Integrase catalytic domain-containing protein n=1 Tax=Papaver atlanticum TaxID=357466 RepID=A0AAD4SHJ0_9MAGN|nr:hypothetical protein MKW98_009486 [Papaver atlanticum]
MSMALPFLSVSENNVHSPLDLIHSDVWVSPLCSVNGFKYYVWLIDSYSRFTWLYTLTYKSEVLPTFIKFKAYVETLFSRRIKLVQSDKGGDYMPVLQAYSDADWAGDLLDRRYILVIRSRGQILVQVLELSIVDSVSHE